MEKPVPDKLNPGHDAAVRRILTTALIGRRLTVSRTPPLHGPPPAGAQSVLSAQSLSRPRTPSSNARSRRPA